MHLPGGPELFIILFVVLLMFGASKLPKLARSMGQAGKEFKAGLKEGHAEGPLACVSCGSELGSGVKFCPECGVEAPVSV